MLLIKRKYLAAVRSGEKRQTIRLWKHRMMRAGQRSYIPGFGHVRVTSVEQLEIGQLTEEDARLDGFSSAEELREELSSIYGDKISAGYLAFRVVFEELNESESAPAKKQ